MTYKELPPLKKMFMLSVWVCCFVWKMYVLSGKINSPPSTTVSLSKAPVTHYPNIDEYITVRHFGEGREREWL
jgi:hypothetical protein